MNFKFQNACPNCGNMIPAFKRQKFLGHVQCEKCNSQMDFVISKKIIFLCYLFMALPLVFLVYSFRNLTTNFYQAYGAVATGLLIIIFLSNGILIKAEESPYYSKYKYGRHFKLIGTIAFYALSATLLACLLLIGWIAFRKNF
jgi:hypothetical protein